MNGQATARQSELFAASRSAATKMEDAVGRREVRLPDVGSVFVLSSVNEPVEWVLIERRFSDGRYLAVLGDSFPLCGGRDLRVETSTGALNLRCQAVVWLDIAVLDSKYFAGSVDPGQMQRVRETVKAAEGEGLLQVSGRGEVDRSVEYRNWIREVVVSAIATARASGKEKSDRSVPAILSIWRRPLPSFATGLAAALAILSLGLAVLGLRQRSEMDQLEASARSAEAALVRERALASETPDVTPMARKESEEVIGLKEKVAALERRISVAGRPIANPPVAILQPSEAIRGEELKTYRIPRSAAGMTLVLRVREDESEPMSYGLKVQRLGDRRVLLDLDGLKRSVEGVQVAIPRRLLPVGSYRLSLFRIASGVAGPIEVYELAIVR